MQILEAVCFVAVCPIQLKDGPSFCCCCCLFVFEKVSGQQLTILVCI